MGISKSSVSPELIEASAEELKQLCEKWLEDLELLMVYLNGMVFLKHHIIVALGVDQKGYKHILGLAQGSSQNAAVCVDLLQDIVKRGVDPQQKLFFVKDGSKALRSAINQVFGDRHPVQRFRNHKIKNVKDHLPDELKNHIKAVMKASWKLNAKEGMEEMFTLNHLGLPPTLTRYLATTNIIESRN